jgi:hypothetical protein
MDSCKYTTIKLPDETTIEIEGNLTSKCLQSNLYTYKDNETAKLYNGKKYIYESEGECMFRARVSSICSSGVVAKYNSGRIKPYSVEGLPESCMQLQTKVECDGLPSCVREGSCSYAAVSNTRFGTLICSDPDSPGTAGRTCTNQCTIPSSPPIPTDWCVGKGHSCIEHEWGYGDTCSSIASDFNTSTNLIVVGVSGNTLGITCDKSQEQPQIGDTIMVCKDASYISNIYASSDECPWTPSLKQGEIGHGYYYADYGKLPWKPHESVLCIPSNYSCNLGSKNNSWPLPRAPTPPPMPVPGKPGDRGFECTDTGCMGINPPPDKSAEFATLEDCCNSTCYPPGMKCPTPGPTQSAL